MTPGDFVLIGLDGKRYDEEYYMSKGAAIDAAKHIIRYDNDVSWLDVVQYVAAVERSARVLGDNDAAEANK